MFKFIFTLYLPLTLICCHNQQCYQLFVTFQLCVCASAEIWQVKVMNLVFFSAFELLNEMVTRATLL